eukprot:CAMPEP_0181376370 /NCGR_PEP_ID=MMETSP1106-20121128/17263_1 /TAXON_ID=81844 /ORGANISM="Mantoniella antarctica, Strain SL-175" /LENGTH=116 /DNA_ID=CAMNT_0023494905 /DNA_START=125 /DNA_END=471 /DNA_ORIENTATION=+
MSWRSGPRQRGSSGDDGDVCGSIGRLALEAEAELERDVAEACAAASREGLDGLPWKRYGHGRRRGRRAVHGGGGGVGGVDWCSDDDEYDEDVSDTDDAADDLELSDSEDGDNGDVR